MAQIYNSLKDFICPVMASKASPVLGEKEANISTASNSIIASLLGVMLKKGDTPQMRNILDEAANLDILPHIQNICEERTTEPQRNIGDNFLQHLLGDKAADFTNPIAEHAGISKVATNRLVAMIAPTVAGYLGNQLQKDNRNLSSLLRQISDEKQIIAPFIPSKLVESFGLASVLNPGTTPNNKVVGQPKKSNNWLMWLILAILVILLFFWWRSCNRADMNMTNNESVAYRDTVAETRVAPAATVRQANRDTTTLTLSNGQMIHAYKGGIEDEMIKYLNSDAYKNATENDLKNKWFEFDNIEFEFNSATEMMGNSQQQIDNIVAILKSYPNARVRIAGFADKRGTEEANMEISKERAKTIEKIFDKGGVGSQVARTEGFGDEHATRPASAPDSERAKDRDIALRFVK